MKQIFPTTQTETTKLSAVEKPITQEQYKDLVNRVNESEEESQRAQDKVDELLSSQQNQIATNQITANNGTVENLSTQTLNSDGIITNCVDSTYVIAHDLDINHRITTEELVSNSGNIGSLVGHDISATDVKANNIESDRAKICAIETNSLILNNVEADDANLENATVSCLNADNITVSNLNSECAIIQEGNVNTLSVDQEKTTNAEVDYLDVNFITHTRNTQEIQETGDFYIVLPEFTNGWYYIEARNDTNRKLWSVEVLNSIKNIQFRWSERQFQEIIDIKITTNASGVSIIQIHGNAQNEHITLYEQSASTNNLLPPEVYVYDTLVDVGTNLVITELNGTYIQDVIFTNKLHVDCLEMDALFMDCVGVYRELWLTCEWVQNGDLNKAIPNCGTLNQYISKRIICNIETPTWTDPATRITTDCNNLTPTDVIARYDGSYLASTGEYDIIYEPTVFDQYDTRVVDGQERDYAEAEYYVPIDGVYKLVNYRYDLKYYTVDGDYTESIYGVYFKKELPITEIHYPLTHLGDVSCVHGSIEVECNQVICCDLLVCNDTEVCGDFKSKHIGDVTSIDDGLQIADKIVTCYCFEESDALPLPERVWTTMPSRVWLGPSDCYPDVLSCRVCCPGYGSDGITKYAIPDWLKDYYVTKDDEYIRIGDLPEGCGIVWEYQDTPGCTACNPYNAWINIDSAIDCAYAYICHYTPRCNYNTAYRRIEYQECVGLALNRKSTDLVTSTVREDELAVYNCDCCWKTYTDEDDVVHSVDGCLLRYNETSNTIEPTDEATLDTLEVKNLHVLKCACIDCDVVIGHDLYVKGTTHTVDEETISTSGDVIILRQNAPAGLSQGEASGIVVRNGNTNVAIVTDRTGTLRSGEVRGTNTTYANLYFYDNKYYTDVSLETEVIPVGDLTAWDSKTVIKDAENRVIQHYTNAIFTQFSYTDISPVLHRDETVNLTDNALLVWNCATLEADTIAIPTSAKQILKAKPIYDSEGVFIKFEYYWERDPGNYHFATMAAYCAVCDDIPIDSYVTIDEVEDYTISEDKE